MAQDKYLMALKGRGLKIMRTETNHGRTIWWNIQTDDGMVVAERFTSLAIAEAALVGIERATQNVQPQMNELIDMCQKSLDNQVAIADTLKRSFEALRKRL
jgi:hypothetical protein